MKVEVIETDITTLAVDAIVNAANESLLGGGGVDGAIHRAAGPALLAACRALPELRKGVRCPTGEARYTPGFNLPAPFVIHTVGPVWHGVRCQGGEEVVHAVRVRRERRHGESFARVRHQRVHATAIGGVQLTYLVARTAQAIGNDIVREHALG